MAEEKKDKKEEPAAAASSGDEPKKPAKPKSGMPLLMGMIVGVIILNAVIAVILIQVTKPVSEEDKEKANSHGKQETTVVEEATTSIHGVALEPTIDVVVNIAQTDGQRFLKLVISLEYDKEKFPEFGAGGGGHGGGGGPSIKPWLGKFKNVLNDQLSEMTLMDLSEPEAKEKIRKNFLRAANGLVPTEEVQFSEALLEQFIIQ